MNRSLTVFGLSPDIWIFVCALVITNIHIVTGNFSNSLMFLPELAVSGQWIRFIMHPFVHISWYHLLLNSSGFFLLYTALEEKRILIKLLYVFVCGFFSLMFSWLFSADFKTLGLCGLSGISHGLMAISSLELMQNKTCKQLAMISFVILILKSIYELISGKAVLAFLLLGMCGTPIAVCHTGGVAGGILIFWSVNQFNTGTFHKTGTSNGINDVR